MTSWLKNELKRIFDVNQGRDEDSNIIAKIRHDSSFHGSNVWALVFAILIASIGLNLNSTAVIIGAMLISPLMGPIMGLGLSLGINDATLLRKSARNIIIATTVSIGVSSLYFYLSPISGVQSELLARTNPTIYDVLIAFFGGLIGVIASTRIQQGNLVPGVAIATALMPPLCTAGYGIATSQPAFFFGALYLFLINSIFICLATLLGVKYLHLPKVAFIDSKQALFTKRIIALVVGVIITPAVYFAFLTVKQNNFNYNIEKYVEENFTQKGYTVIFKNTDYKNNPRKLELAFLSKHFSTSEIQELQEELSRYDISNTELVIKQGERTLTETEWNKAIAGIKDETDKIKALEAKLTEEKNVADKSPDLLAEAQAIDGRIVNVAVGTFTFAIRPDVASTTVLDTSGTQVVLLYTDTGTTTLAVEEKDTLINWLKVRLQDENINVYFPELK